MSHQVRDMFSSIAPSYDRVNTILSLGSHHFWRRRAVKLAGVREGHHALDCATGTGDLALELKRTVGSRGSVVGTDFCPEMLETAPRKAARLNLEVDFRQADALALPYDDDEFDVATIAFGIRNVDDPLRCLQELSRVVRPGGRVMVLEFGQPRGFLLGPLYRLYSRYVMPWLGGLVSGNFEAYRYLPETAAAFPSDRAFVELMKQAAVFEEQHATPLWRGIAYVYVGTVAASPASPSPA